MIAVVDQFVTPLGVAAACDAVGMPRATYYRSRHGSGAKHTVRRSSPRALSSEEKQAVLDLLHEPRFADLPPTEVHAQLLDEEKYYCSVRTMYRILAANAVARSGAGASTGTHQKR